MKLYDLYEGQVRSRDVVVEFAESYDVVIAGLGVAGAVAAITAAENGLKVLGIERLGAPGGIGTLGDIWYYYRGNKGGLYSKIDEYAQMLYEQDREADGFTPASATRGQTGVYKAEAISHFCDLAGVESVYGAMVTGVYREDNKVVGVRWFDGKRTRVTGSKFVIDCTADGVVVLSAGGKMTTGRETDHSFQPYSNIMCSYSGGTLHCANTDSGSLDQYDPYEYGWASLYSATTPMFLPTRFKDDPRFIELAPLLGLREGRTIVGEGGTLVTADKYLREAAEGEDGKAVFYGMSHIDDHSQDFAYGGDVYREYMSLCGLWSLDVMFGIPKNALIPDGLDGILAAGRMVAVDHAVAQAMRMKDDMQKSGECAADIAFLAIRGQIAAKDVNDNSLRALLKDTGCLKDADHAQLMKIGAAIEDEHYLTDPVKFREYLSSDKPGIAILSAKFMPASFTETLEEWLYSDDRLLSHNAALALAIRRDQRALPVLREMLASRDGYTPRSGYYVPDHALAAATAVGLLGDVGSINQLFAMMEPGYTDGIPFFRSYLVQDETALRYEYFTHAHAALLSIASRCRQARKIILQKLDAIIDDPALKLEVGLRATANTVADRTEVTRTVQRNAKLI